MKYSFPQNCSDKKKFFGFVSVKIHIKPIKCETQWGTYCVVAYAKTRNFSGIRNFKK